MSEFSTRMKAHLSRYKVERLGVREDGQWRVNQRPYTHILPETLHRLNILETIRREFWRHFDAHRTTLPLHTDFHHLNSSQAFAFNLFFPWLGLGHPSVPLWAGLGLEPRGVTGWAFEAVPDPAERTTLDLCIQTAEGPRVLVEVKLTEEGFGGGQPNDERRRKLRDVYAPALAGRVTPGSLGEAEFFASYQLFRNVCLLDLERGDVLVLLAPRANLAVWQQAEEFRNRRLTDECRARVRLAAVEDVLAAPGRKASDLPPLLACHAELLAEKYLLPEGG